MKHRFLLLSSIAFLAISLSPTAKADDVQPDNGLMVSRLGDTELSCGALSQEAALMRDIIDTTEDIQDKSKIKSHGINAAAGVGGFLVGTVTGGIGFAAAGFLFDQTAKDEAQDADDVQEIAQQRRSLMVGIFDAKGCLGPIEHAMQDKVSLEKQETQLAAIQTQAGGNDSEERKPHYNQ